ncbi:hypothetical protein ACHAWF_001877, partial [Thalassiosira exigua]
MKLAVLAALAGSAAAFAPASNFGTTSSTAVRMSETVTEEATSAAASEETAAAPAAPAALTLNGWTADAALPCHGLPGAVSPLGFFDPLGFTKEMDLNGVKRFREAEVMHGRVAMMATVGYLIGESTPTITYGMDVHHTIANDQIPEVPGTVLFPFFLAINIAEALRASTGWVEPGLGPLFSLREKYYPGDIGFDPFGLKPKDAEAFANMQTKELSNGRLAMLAA